MPAKNASYLIGLRHHSIARSRTVEFSGSLMAAKRRATREFGDDLLDAKIVIMDADMAIYPEGLVSERRVGAPRWSDRV